jgi:hypothetical protein
VLRSNGRLLALPASIKPSRNGRKEVSWYRNFYEEYDREFVTGRHFRSGLIFAGKARSLPLEWSSKKGLTLVDSSLTNTKMER